MDRAVAPASTSDVGSDVGSEVALPGTRAAATRCWQLGAIVFVQYFLLALDIRFVAARNFVGIMVVNALIAFMGWHVVRGIAQAKTSREHLAYVVGGTGGAVLAVWLS
jgi:hypothetical protein